jgi:hypothetical protein
MKRFVLFIGRVVNALCRKTYWYNEVLFPDCAKFWNHKTFNLDVVNFGSTSGVYAFNYEGIPLKCANWALARNPLSGDEAVLKNYMSYLNPKGSTAIFPLCPFSTLAGSYECYEDRYYTFLYSSSIPSFSKQRQTKVVHMKNRPLKYYPIYELLRDVGRFLVSPFRKKHMVILSEEKMKSDAEKWMTGWCFEFSINKLGTPLSLINKDAINDASAILNRIINLCKDRNITPVFVIPPMYHTLSEKFNPAMRKQLLNSVLTNMEIRGVRFLNYMDDSEFSNKSEFFINSFILNEKGAKKFTKKIISDLSLE